LVQKSSDLEEIWFPSRLWYCELISIVGLLWWPFWIQNGHQNTKIPRFGQNLAIPHFKILLDINFHWNRRPLTIWRPTMDINSQHHNLLGNQISSKSEDFWTQSKLVIIIILIPLFSSASILSGTFLGNRTANPFETWHKNRSSLKVVQLVFKIF
jgi:hypothetical protein